MITVEYVAVLEDLKRQRDRLNIAIGAIENIIGSEPASAAAAETPAADKASAKGKSARKSKKKAAPAAAPVKKRMGRPPTVPCEKCKQTNGARKKCLSCSAEACVKACIDPRADECNECKNRP